jgi:hypothetical protein
MATSVGVRSPYFISWDAGATANSYKFLITIDGTLAYEIIKNVPDTNKAGIDVSELIKDYINISYTGTLPIGSSVASDWGVEWYAAINAYTEENAAGSLVAGSPQVIATRTGYLGYAYYSDEDPDFIYASTTPFVSSYTLWYPEDTAGYFYSNESGTITRQTIGTSTTSVSAGGETITIRRFPCNKYTPVKLVFANRYGMLQELYFFTKSTESTSFTREKYKSSSVSYAGVYQKEDHQMKSFNINAKTEYELNTGHISEDYNEFMKELMLSEQVWAHIDGEVRPVDVTSSSVTYKTSLNDKLVSYTVTIEQSNDLISSMR